jgi:hypothetical protein
MLDYSEARIETECHRRKNSISIEPAGSFRFNLGIQLYVTVPPKVHYDRNPRGIDNKIPGNSHKWIVRGNAQSHQSGVRKGSAVEIVH